VTLVYLVAALQNTGKRLAILQKPPIYSNLFININKLRNNNKHNTERKTAPQSASAAKVTMRIRSLLNDGPSSSMCTTAPVIDPAAPRSSTAASRSSATRAGDPEQRRPVGQATVVNKEPLVHHGSGIMSISSPMSSSVPASTPIPHMMSNLPYSPYQHGPIVYREHTASSRSPYSEPSITASTAATSPLEKSMLQQHQDNSTWFGGNAIVSGGTTSTVPAFSGHSNRDQQQQRRRPLPRQQQQKALPPFTTLVNMQQQPAIPAEGAISLRSTAHRPPQGGQGGAGGAGESTSYFPSASYVPQYTQPRPRPYGQPQHQQQQHQPPIHAYAPSTGQSSGSGGGATDPLMRFADVAMESATLVGRRILEEVLAAETTRGGAEGSVDEDGTKQRDGGYSSINIEYGSVVLHILFQGC